MSSPSSHAVALQILYEALMQSKSSDDKVAHVIDIASGSSYFTCALALCFNSQSSASESTRPRVRVTGVDHSATLVEQARDALRQNHPALLSSGQVEFRQCPSDLSLIASMFSASHSGFAAIHIGFAVREATLPASLLSLLRPGGVLLAPMSDDAESHQQLTLLKRSADASSPAFKREHIMSCVFAPQRCRTVSQSRLSQRTACRR